MKLTDQELTVMALREAPLILADHDLPGARDSEKTIQQLLAVLARNDVVEAVERLEHVAGLRVVD